MEASKPCEWKALAEQPCFLHMRLVPAALLALAAAGCSNSLNSGGTPPANTSQLYFAGAAGSLANYTIDNTADTFVVTTYGAAGSSIEESGSIMTASNGVVGMEVSLEGAQVYNPPLSGNWAVEWPGQAALVRTSRLVGTTTTEFFTPLVPAQSCPSLMAPQVFQFITVPRSLAPSGSTKVETGPWIPQLETAYGSVEIATSGGTVTFSDVSQFTFPAANGGTPGAPSTPYATNVTAACSPTYYGQTISVPANSTIANPGNNQGIPPTATVGIGLSGFLVEDAGSPSGTDNQGLPAYDNFLGAGYGAIGLPTPSTALSTSVLTSAQYQGILYGSGGPLPDGKNGTGFSLFGSFGYTNLQSSCPTLPAPATTSILYGGEFANDNPSASAFGNCDLAVDLGSQDAKNNGLYPAATVYVSAAFPRNGIVTAYSFPAVAVAGQIQSKYAILLIGLDTAGSPSQAWGIYLLQSN